MVQQAKRKAETGVANEHYNLVSIMYHSLQSAAVCELYSQDAEQAGDQELTNFFKQVKEQASQQAEQAKKLMFKRMS
jgi:hypothetical protein